MSIERAEVIVDHIRRVGIIALGGFLVGLAIGWGLAEPIAFETRWAPVYEAPMTILKGYRPPGHEWAGVRHYA